MILITIAVAVVGVLAWMVYKAMNPGPPPQLDPHAWWGPEELQGNQDRTIRPFQVKFTDEMINDLKARLKNHRPLTPPLDGVGFQYGFNNKELDSWITYWAEKYPFAEREKFLNQYPQFKTNIQGLDIHFIRVKPDVAPGTTVVPILLMHGWPGSVREFYEAVPFLTKQQPGYDFVFEVVVPSLPGYGFSDASIRPNLSPPQIAVVFKNLMDRLGLPRFYVQGGDWGSVIASSLATLFPENVLGHHTNMAYAQNDSIMIKTILGAFWPSLVIEPHLADRFYPLSKFFNFMMAEFGYFHLQATKPDTLGVGLSDSPAGLMAYILEKFSSWTNFDHRSLSDGGLTKGFSKEQLIDNVMIYWSTNSITTSIRLYAESFTECNRNLDLDKYYSNVPTWALQAKYELFYQPPSILKLKYKNLIGNTVLNQGGHFLAFELPEEFSNDVFKAVNEMRKWRTASKKI